MRFIERIIVVGYLIALFSIVALLMIKANADVNMAGPDTKKYTYVEIDGCTTPLLREFMNDECYVTILVNKNCGLDLDVSKCDVLNETYKKVK